MMPAISVQKVHAYTGHNDCLYALQAISDTQFVSAGGDGMVIQWDLTDLTKGTLIAKVPASIYALKYDMVSGYLVVGQNFEGIHVIDPATKKEVRSLKLTDSQIFDIQMDDRYIYVACGDGELFVVEKSGFKVVSKKQVSTNSLRTIAIKDNHLAIGASDNHIRVFDKSDLQLLHEINAHGFSVFSLTYHPTGQFLLSGSRDAHLKIWDATTYLLQEDIVAHMYAINHIAFNGDGRHFVTCSMDKSIKIWDSANFKLLKVIDKARHAGHGTSVNKLLWMEHNDYLISCSDDQSVSVWDINFGDT